MEMNFGYLNNIIKTSISEDVSSLKSKMLFKEYINILNNDDVLKEQFFLFKNINEINNIENKISFIRENINLLLSKFSPKEINEGNMRLYSFIKENELNTNTCKNSLFENVGCLLTTDKTLNTIHLIETKYIEINNMLNENERTNIIEDFDIENDLNDDEKKVLEKLYNLNDEELENIFNKEKEKCIEITNQTLKDNNDLEIKESLLNVKEKLLEQKFCKDTIIIDYITLTELYEDLSS